MTLHGALDRAVEEFADRPLFITDEHSYTYREMQEWSRRMAAGLLELGVEQGDHVALLMANHPQFAAAKFAVSRAGATCIPVNYLFRSAELGYVLQQSDAKVLITMDRYRDLDYLEALDQLAPGWEAGGGGEAIAALQQVVVFSPSGRVRDGAMSLEHLEDVATQDARDRLAQRETDIDPRTYSDILYTSGTTGKPKGVLLKHDQIVREAYAAAYQRALEDGRRLVFPLPMYHVFGYIECLVPVLFVGGAVVPQVVFDAPAMLRAVATHQAQELVAVPAVTLPLMAEFRRGGYDVSSVHTVFSSGGMAPPTIWDDIADVFGDPEVVTGYGMTETTATTTCTNPEDDKALVRTTNGRLRDGGAAGDPELGGKVAVYKTVDPESGEDLEPGQEGHLLARGMVVTDGYYRKPEETALAFTEDGWLRTGDIGSIDADGWLRLTGRLKESFRVGGEMVMPREIEIVLGEHQSVAEAHVAGIPHSRMGEVAAAWIVCRDPERRPDPAELVQHCEDRLARFKVPRHIFFTTLEELPLTATGRCQKFRLTEMAQRRLASSSVGS
jgi:fatty-acyl-CoA synthase